MNYFNHCIEISVELGEQTLLMAVFDTLDLKKKVFHSQASQEKSKQ